MTTEQIPESIHPSSFREAARRVARLAGLALVAASTACSAPAVASRSPVATPTAAPSPEPTPPATASAVTPTPSPATTISFEPLDPAAFALEAGPPAGFDGVHAHAVEPYYFGWLAGGAYNSTGNPPAADAVAWFSPDGLDWERMAAPTRACDGYQSISAFLGHPIAWALGGCEIVSSGDSSRIVSVVWRLRDDRTWGLVDTRCTGDVRCGGTDVAVVQALRLAEYDDAFGEGWLLGAGFAGSRFSALRLELDGSVSKATRLPMPAWADYEEETIARSITRGPDQEWVITALTDILGEEGPTQVPVAWRSTDGSNWSLLGEQAVESLREANVLRIDGTEDGWFALGEQLLWSTDLVSWTEVTAPAGVGWWHRIAMHRETFFAFVDATAGDVQLLQSRDGSTWTRVDVPDGLRLTDGASDYETFIVVGSHGPNAGAWRVVLPG